MTALTKTRQDLVNQALRNLQVLAAGQTADTEDYESVDGHVDASLAQLDARQIVSVPDAQEIPIEWFDPLAVVLADDAAMEFGLPGVPASPSNPNPRVDAEVRLREMVYSRPTGEQLEPDYF